jgi:hypothetical protein
VAPQTLYKGGFRWSNPKRTCLRGDCRKDDSEKPYRHPHTKFASVNPQYSFAERNRQPGLRTAPNSQGSPCQPGSRIPRNTLPAITQCRLDIRVRAHYLCNLLKTSREDDGQVVMTVVNLIAACLEASSCQSNFIGRKSPHMANTTRRHDKSLVACQK